MDTEEFNRIHTITEEVKKRQREITELIESGKDLSDIHVARGRLIQYIKSNIKELQDLYDKYDMYMTVYEVINNDEDKKDKINYIKNLIYKNSYTPFEEKLLNIINSNIDDIDKMKKEFNDLDENNGIKELIELRETHAKELEKHRKNIDQRYRDEFIKKKTNLLSVVTMLPKAVGLACKKVATCVKEVKQAKTNKEKLNKIFAVFKASGQVLATPIIFTGKFIVDHWYLLLVGIVAVLKLFPGVLETLGDLFKRFFFFFKKKKKKKDDDKDKKDGKEAAEPVAEPAAEEAEAPATLHNSAINYQADPRFQTKPATTPVTVPHTSAINYQTDPRFQVQPAQVTAETPHTSAINYQTDPRFQAPKILAKTPNTSTATTPQSAEPVEEPIPEVYTPNLSEQDLVFLRALCDGFVSNAEANFVTVVERLGYYVATRHPNARVIRSEADYHQYFKDETGMDWPVGLDAKYDYDSIPSMVMPRDRQVIWPDIEVEKGRLKAWFNNDQEFLEYVLSGKDSALTNSFIEYVNSNCDPNYLNSFSRDTEALGDMFSQLKGVAPMAILAIALYFGIDSGAVQQMGISIEQYLGQFFQNGAQYVPGF